MSETKYVKNKGVIILEENLPEIINKLIDKYYVEEVTVNKRMEYIAVIRNYDYSKRKYHFGECIIIGEDKIESCRDNGKEYTACWLFNTPRWMGKLYADNNVDSFTVAQDSDGLRLTVDGESCSIKYGVIVFDENNHFVECFDDNNINLDLAMEAHGYHISDLRGCI